MGNREISSCLGKRSRETRSHFSRIVTAGYDNTARIWDAATGQPVGEPLRHKDTVKRDDKAVAPSLVQ